MRCGPHFAGLNSVPVSWNEVWRVLPKRLDSTPKGIAICHVPLSFLHAFWFKLVQFSMFVLYIVNTCKYLSLFLFLCLLYAYINTTHFFITCKSSQTQPCFLLFFTPPSLLKGGGPSLFFVWGNPIRAKEENLQPIKKAKRPGPLRSSEQERTGGW